MFRVTRYALFVWAGSLLAAGLPAGPDAAMSQAKAALAQLPLRFEANQGQTDPAVRYTAHAGGYTLFLKTDGATLSLGGKRRVDISLQHANRSPEIEGVDRQASRIDYYVGKRDHWRTGVASYSRVRYREVYRGVDVVYYGNQNQLEYDFVIQPGADPGAIRMKFSGAARVSISPEGDLVLEAGGQRLVQKKPLIYQEDPRTASRREVAGNYVMVGRNTVGVRLDHYDASRKLVIDPVLAYCTYVGGTGTDQVTAAKIAPNGKLYIVASTDTGQLPYIDGAYDNFNDGLTDIYVSIIDITPGGGYGLVYASYLGGSNLDIPLALDVDAAGVVYLTGTTTSTDFPVTGNAFQSTGAATTIDAFVAKLDPSGYGGSSLIYSSYLGGTTGNESGNGIAVDQNGLIYVIGTTLSSDFPVTTNAYQQVSWGAQDTFICQIDPSAGSLLYSTYLGGENDDTGRAILVGSNGLVYFAASTLSTQFPMAGYNYSATPFGTQNIIIGVLDMTKQITDSLVYATYFGGSVADEVHSMAFDVNGNLLITGYTLSPDFPVTGNALQGTYGGNGDAYVAVVNPANPFQQFLVYSTFLGGAHGEVGYGVAGDPAGNIYVTGYTLSSNFPTTANAMQAQWGNGTDLFITKLNPKVAGAGALQYSTFLGATGVYVPSGVVVGPDGTAYVVGHANIGLPSSANATQGGYAGGVSDGFLLVLTQ